jgi:hypothetical protein
LRLHDKTNNLQQVNYNFITLLSDTGGVSASIMAILGSIAIFFNYQFFMQTVLSNVFLVKKSLSGAKLATQDSMPPSSTPGPETKTAFELKIAEKETLSHITINETEGANY